MTDYTKIPLVFNVHKPVGKSSFFPVHLFRRNLSYDFDKIGHFGTLDPFANGVLLIGVQGAQKMNNYVHQYMTKTYEACGIFGLKTNSGDLETDIIAEKEISSEFKNLSKEEMQEVIEENFLGEYWQAPHAVSAVKYKGRRLYKLALEGKFIVLEKRKRDIKKINVISFHYPELKFEIEVSSGTYIRSFFEDLAELLGGVGCLKTLTRTKIGHLDIVHSITEDLWPKENQHFELEKYGIRIDQLFHLNQLHIEPYSAARFVQGQRCPIHKAERINSESPSAENIFWLYSEGELLGMCNVVDDRISTVFNLRVAISRYS